MFYDPTVKVDPFELQEFMPWLSKADITTPSGKDIYSAISSAGLEQDLLSTWKPPEMSNFSFFFGDQAFDPYSSLSLENEGVRNLYTQALGQTQDSRLMDAYKSAMGYDQYKPDPYAYTSFGGGYYGLNPFMNLDFSKMYEGPEFVQAAKTWATEQTAKAATSDKIADLQNKLVTDPNFKYQTTMEDWKLLAGAYEEARAAATKASTENPGFDLGPTPSGMLVGYQNGVPVYAGATGASTLGGQYLVNSSGNLTYMEGHKGKGGFFREHIGKIIPKEIRRYVPAIGSVIGIILGAGNPAFAALGSGIGSLLVGDSGQQILTNAGTSAVASYLAGGNAWSDVSDALIGDSLVGNITPAELAAQEMAEQATTQALVDQGINPYYLDAATAELGSWSGWGIGADATGSSLGIGGVSNVGAGAETGDVLGSWSNWGVGADATGAGVVDALGNMPAYEKMKLLNVAISAIQGPYEQPTAGMQNTIAGYFEQPTAGIQARGEAPGWQATNWKDFNARMASMGRGGGMVTGARANEAMRRGWYDRYLRENGYA